MRQFSSDWLFKKSIKQEQSLCVDRLCYVYGGRWSLWMCGNGWMQKSRYLLLGTFDSCCVIAVCVSLLEFPTGRASLLWPHIPIYFTCDCHTCEQQHLESQQNGEPLHICRSNEKETWHFKIKRKTAICKCQMSFSYV